MLGSVGRLGYGAVKKTSTRLADGRELIYYDLRDDTVRDAVDRRPLERTVTTSEIRHDPLLGDSVAVASHRQGRTYHPPADECPLCPSQGRPAQRDPGLLATTSSSSRTASPRWPATPGAARSSASPPTTTPSFADLTEEQARLVLDAWTDRTAELSHLPSVEQVFCFENRGAEIGVTLGHPHGQIYAYPFTTPRTALMLRSRRRAQGGHRRREPLRRRRGARTRRATRVVLEGEHWVGLRAVRRPLALRGAPLPASAGCRTCSALDEDGAHRVPPGLPGTLAALRPDLRRR